MRLLIGVIIFLASTGAALAQDGRALSGKFVLPEPLTLPAETELLIELRSVTGSVVDDFTLPLDDPQGAPGFSVQTYETGALEFRAALRVGTELRWLSEAVAIPAGSVAVDLGAVLLRRFMPMGFATTLTCGEVLAELGFIGDIARLRIGGRYFDLLPEDDVDGSVWVMPGTPATRVRFLDDTVVVDVEGTRLADCREEGAVGGYRARGDRGAWSVIIVAGRLNLLGFGAVIDTALPEPGYAAGQRRYALTDAGMTLSFSRTICRHPESRLPYPDRAVLEAGDETFAGCGGQPLDLLTGVDWDVLTIDANSVREESKVALRFGTDGRVSGTGGCNAFHAQATVGADVLRIGPVVAGSTPCEEIYAGVESRFLATLERVDGFDIGRAGELILTERGRGVIAANRR